MEESDTDDTYSAGSFDDSVVSDAGHVADHAWWVSPYWSFAQAVLCLCAGWFMAFRSNGGILFRGSREECALKLLVATNEVSMAGQTTEAREASMIRALDAHGAAWAGCKFESTAARARFSGMMVADTAPAHVSSVGSSGVMPTTNAEETKKTDPAPGQQTSMSEGGGDDRTKQGPATSAEGASPITSAISESTAPKTSEITNSWGEPSEDTKAKFAGEFKDVTKTGTGDNVPSAREVARVGDAGALDAGAFDLEALTAAAERKCEPPRRM